MTNSDLFRLAALGLTVALTLGAAPPATAQTAALSYPRSRALPDVSAWLQSDTPISPTQVVDISPSAITAVVAVTPTGEPRGFLANINSEATDPEIEAHDGIASWSIPVEVDCDRRAVRLGTMTGYRSRDLRSQPKVLRPADTAFVNPTPGAPLGAVIRALCDRDFRRPLAGGRLKLAAKAPYVAKPAKTPAAVPEPAPASAPNVGGSVSVQIAASPSRPDAKGLLARFKTQSPDLLSGLTTDVATVAVDGKTVHRALISGFATGADATRFCEKLKARGQACFVRR